MKPPSNESEQGPSPIDEKPAMSSAHKALESPVKRHQHYGMLAGLPELSYFDSDEKRDLALMQAGKKVGRSGWGALYVGCAAGLSAIFALYVIEWIGPLAPGIRRFGWAVQFVILLPVMFLTIRWFYRRRFSGLLRQALIEQGVPMCLKCGYNLRGQPMDSTRCPECGNAINEPSRLLLARHD